MSKIILILFLFILSFISCQQEKSPVGDFTIEKYIYQDKSFHVEESYLANPYLIMWLDSFLIVNDPFELKHFTLFDNHTGKYICRFGDIGVGPNELLIGNVLEINDNKLISYDIPRKFLYEYSVTSIVI